MGVESKTYSRTIFNSDIALYVEIYGSRADEAYEEMDAECDALNRAINGDFATSDVYKFNHSVGEIISGEQNVLGKIDKRYKIEVTRYTYELVSIAIEAYGDTDCAYSVTVERIMSLWGVDADGLQRVEQTGKPNPLPSQDQIFVAVNGVQHPLLIEPVIEDGKYYLIKDDKEITVDLGGIAKGYLADRLALIAQKHGLTSAIIDVGGTLRLVGAKPGSSEWKVGVRTPSKYSTDYICAIKLPKDSAVSTSGTYERGFVNGSLYVCHIIDPLTGYPVTVERSAYDGMLMPKVDYICSATVWGRDATLCDVMSTALCVKGKDGARFIKQAGMSAVMFSSYGTMYTIGDVEFIDGYDAYKAYERVAL